MKYNILLTGYTGLFGSTFIKKTKINDNYIVTGISKKKPADSNNLLDRYICADIVNRKQILTITKKIKPSVIVHAASIGNVDYCEQHKKEAWAVNVEGTRNIIKAAESIKALLIFFSTNAVYDGKKPPFNELAKKNPIDFYGLTKVISEDDIRKSKIPFVIVRLMTMYGWHDKKQRLNPVTWMINELKNEHALKVVKDIYNNHLYVGQAVECVLKILKLQKWNQTFNIAGQDCISRYQLALSVADVFSLNKKLIQPVSSNFFKFIAPRPKNTCFLTAKMEKELKINPLSIREGLTLMLHENQ